MATTTNGAGVGRLLEVPRDQVVESPLNPRKTFHGLEELAEDLRARGIIQALVVRPRPDGLYEVVAGARRFRAAGLAGLESLPVVVREDLDDETTLAMMFAENYQRRELNPIEIAEAIEAMLRMGRKGKDVAEAFGIQPSTVSNHRKLLKLPASVQDLVRTGKIGMSLAEELVSFAEHPETAAACEVIAELAAERGLTVRDCREGVPFATELQQRGAAVRFEYNGPDPTADPCKQCPWNARRKAGYYTVCLYPEHYREVAEQVRAAREAEREAAAAAARARAEAFHVERSGEDGAPAALPVLGSEELPWGVARELSCMIRPAACTDACPCFGFAVRSHAPDKPEPVCLNPARFDQLYREQRERKLAAAEAGAAARLEQVLAVLQERQEITPLELGQLVRNLFDGWHQKEWKEAARLLQLDLPKGALDFARNDPTPQADALAQLAPRQLVSLALLVSFLKEAESYRGGYREGMPLTDRFLGIEPEPAPEEGRKGGAVGRCCDRCGAELVGDNYGVPVGLDEGAGPNGRVLMECRSCQEEGADGIGALAENAGGCTASKAVE